MPRLQPELLPLLSGLCGRNETDPFNSRQPTFAFEALNVWLLALRGHAHLRVRQIRCGHATQSNPHPPPPQCGGQSSVSDKMQSQCQRSS